MPVCYFHGGALLAYLVCRTLIVLSSQVGRVFKSDTSLLLRFVFFLLRFAPTSPDLHLESLLAPASTSPRTDSLNTLPAAGQTCFVEHVFFFAFAV